jgi:hypothetical protein
MICEEEEEEEEKERKRVPMEERREMQDGKCRMRSARCEVGFKKQSSSSGIATNTSIDNSEVPFNRIKVERWTYPETSKTPKPASLWLSASSTSSINVRLNVCWMGG